MRRVMIQLKDIEEVKEFVTITSETPYEVDLVAGRYVINAKSIMGVLSLDLCKNLKLEIHSDDDDSFMNKIEKFIVVE